ncbi:MAG: rhomboid family intramembrane serine protease [Deltaproteobacteria bacterium]|nr:rhomboid family intramembrane serine protease [Deltaproteobacteria bacterium]
MIFPLRDRARPRSPAYVTLALVLLNAVAFWAEARLLHSGGEPALLPYTLVPRALIRLQWDAGLGGLFPHMFLHGGLMHLVGNLWFLWAFGGPAEGRLGHAGLLGIYVLGGVAGALLQVAAEPSSGVPLVGASGAISGVMGAFLWEMGRRNLPLLVVVWRVEVRAWVFVLGWAGMQVVDAFSSLGRPAGEGGVAFFAHVGGFAVGLCATAVAGKR